MIIKNITRGIVLADKAVIADSFFSRLKGLLGKTGLGAGEALVMPGCNSIHTFFMRFAIDVLFLDANGKVVGRVENIPPFRASPVFWSAKTVVELPAHTIKDNPTKITDTITID